VRLRILWLIALAVCLLSAPFTVQAAEEQTIQEKALLYVSTKYNIPIEKLKIVSDAVRPDAITKEQMEFITVFDMQSNSNAYKLVANLSGDIMESTEYYKITAGRYYEKYGKLSPSLYELLQSKAFEDKVKVNIWLKSNDKEAVEAVAIKYPEAKLSGQRPSRDTDIKLYEKIQAEMNDACE
jgi:hypothetical protein